MKPYIHDDVYFLWNLHASVGKGGMNSNSSDISYLQWYYTLAANFPETPAERKAIYKNVKITGFCSGRDDDPLVKAIFAQQRGLNHPVIDGRASAATGASGGQRVGDKAFFVVRLGARFATMYPKQWPRLDLIPGCPASVAKISLEAVPKI